MQKFVLFHIDLSCLIHGQLNSFTKDDVERKKKLLGDLGADFGSIHTYNVVTFLKCSSKCEANGKALLIQCSLAKHQKLCPHECNFNANPQTLPLTLLQMPMY